jgi:Rab-3A-interacting protein
VFLFLPAAEPMFWEIMRLRKEMSLAKLGFFPQEP